MTQEQAATTSSGLREAFDRAFAGAPVTDAGRTENFLAIRVGGEPHAIALAEIAGLFTDKKIVALPGRAPELLGIAGLRGDIIPVYSLRAFLGYPPTEEPTHWLVLAGREQAVSFAFDRFDGYARILHTELSPVPGTSSSHGHTRAMATIAGVRRSIISVHSILNTIASRPLKEH